MHRTVAVMLVFVFLLCACAPVDSETSAPSEVVCQEPSVSAPPQSEPDPPAAPESPGVVKKLAAQRVRELEVSSEQGEAGIHTLYRYLIENVYFADPVGLDTWRWMTEDNMQPIPFLDNRALSPLLFGIGSCEDFAAAMVLLLRAAGYEAEYVAGYTLSVESVYIDHAWAIVELDGSWYHLDPQLEQNVIRAGVLTYRYYMKSDGDLETDHQWGERLMELWPEMPESEQRAIREQYTYPACPAARPAPVPEKVPLPPKPNMAVVEETIARIREESGWEDLPPLALHVEPPVLVRERHITPPLLPQKTARYWRGGLSGAEVMVYSALESMVPEMSGGVLLSMPGAGSAELKAGVEAFTADYPIYDWVKYDLPEKDGAGTLNLSMQMPREEADRREEELEQAAAAILRGCVGLSEFERATYIHDYLAENTAYDYATSFEGGTVYGALVKGYAYCDGYARAYQYLCQGAGLEVVYLTGRSARGVDHAWNAVQLDGAWHYVDVTWDRPRLPEDRVYHDYFLINEAELLRERQADEGALLPARGAVESYYRRMQYVLEGVPATDTLAEMFFRQLCAGWRGGDQWADYQPFFLEVRVEGGGDYERWKAFYIKQVFEILQRMEQRARAEHCAFTISYNTSVRCDFNDAMQVLTFYPQVKRTEE